jgi:hypothetical protein
VAGGAAAVGGIKLLAKTGAVGAVKIIATEEVAVTAGKVIASKRIATTAGKLAVGSAAAKKGVATLTEYEAETVLSTTAYSALRSESELMSEKQLPNLFRKYPGLSGAVRDNKSFERLLDANPRLLDDASVELYRTKPSLFAKEFQGNALLNISPDAFAGSVHEKVSAQNSDAVKNLLLTVRESLEKKGIPATELGGLEQQAREKLVEKVLSQEIDHFTRDTGYEWAYKSGVRSVKGKVGHFAFEQEVSIPSLAKATAIGTAAISGYKVVWSKDSFVQVESCVDNFCINVDSRRRTLNLADGLRKKP